MLSFDLEGTFVGLSPGSVGCLEVDGLAVYVKNQEFQVVVYKNREIGIGGSDRAEAVVVLVTGNPEVYPGIVEDGNEQFAYVLVAVPVIQPRGDMTEYYPYCSILESLGFGHLLQPN